MPPRVPGDVIVLPERGGRWVVMNVFSRTCLAVDTAALEPFRAAETLSAPELEERFKGAGFGVWEVWHFSQCERMGGDTSNFRRDVSKWPAEERLAVAALVERFKRHFLLIDDDAAYRARFAAKRGIVDHERFGNFREQFSQALAMQCPTPHTFWADRKFSKDRKSINEGPYKAVQENFLKGFFSRKLKPGDNVVDLGCGTGYYANMMAGMGASVLGVDPNRSLIDIARETAVPGTRFEVALPGKPGALDTIPSASADLVFMADVVVMYFSAKEFPSDIDACTAEIRRILKPDGTLVVCDPHPAFYLKPWLGDVDRPFTVITEYLTQTFSPLPPMQWVVQSFAKAGFSVRWAEELSAGEGFEKGDERGAHFAREFPLWMVWEMKAR